MRLVPACVLALLLIPASALAVGPRLDRDVWPTTMAVDLVTDPARTDYTGRVSAEVEVRKTLDHIRMHGRRLTVTRARIQGGGGEIALEVSKPSPDQISLACPKPLAPGKYTLTIDFRNEYSRRAASLYRVETGGRSYLFTQFEATEAREAFPCWDEPEFKFPWQLTLTVPKDLMAVSNTPIEKETPAANGQKRVRFMRTKPLPSYLIAIAVGAFESVPIHGMSVPGRVVCVQGAGTMAAEAARVTPPMLAALEKYFGRPYPYEKLDLIAAPEFLYGAMENAGAIVFADRRLLLDAKTGSATEHRQMRGVIAHELAHQWFGDLVTMKWWDDLWLNESFASWMGTKVMDQVFPEYRAGQNGFDAAFRAVATDSRPSTGAMRQPIESEDNLTANANELTYNKGKAVLGMFEGWLGVPRFRAGVIEYLTEHEWKNATGDQLWSAISHASGDDINAAMSSFLDQPGVPIVTIEPLQGGRLRVKQERFMSDGEKSPKPQTWRIPVILGLADGKGTRQQRVWLTEAEQTIAIEGAKPEWILPNSGSSGYYVWNVPPAMLGAMAADRARLTPVERVGFIRNLVVLQRAGLVPVEDLLPLLRAFRDDPEPEVVTSVIDALEAIREPLVSSEIETIFAQHVRQMLRPAAERMGMDRKPREIPAATAMRPKLLKTLGDMGMDPEVRRWADAFTQRVLQGADADPALAEAALPLSAQRGDAGLAKQFQAAFEAAKIPTERQQYLVALGSFRNPAIGDQVLEYALRGALRPQEVLTLPATMAEWPEMRDQLYRWMTSHYDEVLQHVPAHMISRLMPIVRGCSEPRLAEARTFFADPSHTFPGAKFVLNRTGDQVEECVRMSKRDGARFAEYLRGASAAQ